MVALAIPVCRLPPEGTKILFVRRVEHKLLADGVLCEQPRKLVLVPLLGVGVELANQLVVVGAELAVVVADSVADCRARRGGDAAAVERPADSSRGARGNVAEEIHVGGRRACERMRRVARRW